MSEPMSTEREGLAAEIAGWVEPLRQALMDAPDRLGWRQGMDGDDYRELAESLVTSDALADLLAARDRRVRAEALRPLDRLFSGGPDTPCRTTYPDGVECVEVPMADLREAFDRALTEADA